MSKRTRAFVLTASAVLAVGLGTAGVASYMNLGQIGLGPSPSDELSFIPASADMVAYANIQHLMASELGRKLQPELTRGQDADNGPLAQAGIDLTRDVDSIVVAGLPAAGDPAREAPLVFARGRFDYARIESLITAQGGEVSHHGDTRLVASESVAVAFLGPTLILVAQPDDVKQALETKAGAGQALGGDADFIRLARRVENDDTWAVARFDALQQRASFPGPIAEHLPAITWFVAGGRIDAGISGQLYAEARDEQAAQDLRQVVQGLLSLLRLQAGQQRLLAELLNTIQLGGEGTGVSIAFSVSKEMIDQLDVLRKQAAPPPAATAPLSGPRRRSRPAGPVAAAGSDHVPALRLDRYAARNVNLVLVASPHRGPAREAR